MFIVIAPLGADMSTEEYKEHFNQTSNLLDLLKADNPNLVTSNVKT